MPRVKKKRGGTGRGAAASSKDFDGLYRAIKPIFSRYEGRLEAVADEPGKYYLKSRTPVFRGKPVWFGGLEIKKNYVSVHLTGMYVFPELAAKLSPELKKRKQGKGCFNFTSADPKLFAELKALTEAGMAKFRAVKPGSEAPKGNCD